MVERDTAWPAGTPAWVDLMTTDADSARGFYTELFGWDWEVGGEETGFYAQAKLRGRSIVGAMTMQEQAHPPVWSTYLATDDAEATMRRAVDAGAEVVVEVTDVMDLGRMGLFRDPTGGVVGLWQAGSYIGYQLANEPGAVIWNELLTRDLDRARSFYADVFGYTFTDLGEGGYQYSTVEVDGNTIGGIGAMPDMVPPEVPAHWRVYFAVDNADDAVDRVVKLGGSVLKPPEDMPYGRWADAADPQGAPFAVIAELPSSDDTEQ